VADIPGLIVGASQGKGLGFQFLRHVENCQSLVFVLSLDEQVLFDENMTDAAKVKLLKEQLKELKNEMSTFSEDLLSKPTLVVINKKDLYSESLIKLIEKQIPEAILISGATTEGIDQLKKAVLKLSNTSESE
jgi:GTPase